MSHRAIVLEICQRGGVLDPGEFYALPGWLQAEHIDHFANMVEGWYAGHRPRSPGPPPKEA